mgnify:CR=1 FL=1
MDFNFFMLDFHFSCFVAGLQCLYSEIESLAGKGSAQLTIKLSSFLKQIRLVSVEERSYQLKNGCCSETIQSNTNCSSIFKIIMLKYISD